MRYEIAAVTCRNCLNLKSRVYDSEGYPCEDNDALQDVIRRRQCIKCGRRFLTRERFECYLDPPRTTNRKKTVRETV